MKRTRVLLLCAAAGVVASIGCRPKETASDESAKMSDEAGEEAAQRIARIDAETATLEAQDSWAGVYYYGDGLGVNVGVHIAPKSGFEFEWHGCVGLYDRNWGDTVERDGLLELTFHFPNDRKGFVGLDATFVPVKWGERRYLIAPKEMKSFCNAVNSGDEPRPAGWGMFLMRRDEIEKPPTGRPVLPREFAAMVLDAPLHANVVAVKESRLRPRNGEARRVTVVTLDVGSKNGAWEGMKLFLGDSIYDDSVTITKCDDSSCEAEHVLGGTDSTAPTIGTKVTTRPQNE